MQKKKFVFTVITCLFLGCASTGFGAMTLKRIGVSPFYSPPLRTEANLKTLVETRDSDLRTGFSKAGASDLYPAFAEQFPTTKIESISIQPGETMQWMLFKKKGKGPVLVARDVTWGGDEPFEAFRFYITKDQNRYEFVVPYGCGNVALKDVTAVEVVAAPVVAPPPVTVVPQKMAGGFLVDGGLAYTFDPESYAFARIGYEIPLRENWSVIGLVGGFGHLHGDYGESAFVADALLEYSWTRFSVGFGGGYWSGDGGQMDLIAEIEYRLSEDTNSMWNRTSLLFEVRSAVDELDTMRDEGRVGLGIRYRF